MSSSKHMFSIINSSILRNHNTLNLVTKILPVRFLSPLRFNRYTTTSSSSVSAVVDPSATLAAGSAQSSQLNHPWPEWVSFVDRLKSKGYLPDTYTTTTTSAAAESGSGGGGGDEDEGEGAGRSTDAKFLKHACLSFARDRFDIFKLLSMQDIQTIVEKGCPSLLRKVVNSAKRLRVHLQLDEGEVCGACNLRGSCDRAYVILTDSEASARTVDIVRILLLCALDPGAISEGQMSPGRDVEASARKLLSELIELSETIPTPEIPNTSLPKAAVKTPQQKKESLDVTDAGTYRNVEMKKGDWMCPQCNFLNFARNMHCLKCSTEGPITIRVSKDIEMKKGDWNCPVCGIMNYASKIKCFRCSEPRPKRQLNPGEWECPSCDFLNYRRNRVCKKCNCDRPPRQLNPGEWECPSCDFLNFRANVVCKKCNCDRPKDVDTGSEQEFWKKPLMHSSPVH